MSQSPEDYEAPKRGEHVETTNQDFDYPTEVDKEPELPEDVWSEDTPIPVYIVDRTETPELQNWSSERFQVVDSAIQLAGARRNRTRMVVKNEGADPVFIDPEQSVTSAFSFRLAANEEVELLHNASVWARCDATESAQVSVIQEYTVSLDHA